MADQSDAGMLPRWVRVRVVIRSLWVQASLNYRGMQNLGRLFCLVPVARWLKLNHEQWSAFVSRHTSFFNSNPFISPLGLGALARLEADHHRGVRPLVGDMIERFSARLSAPLGAVGDQFFWAAVRPQMVLLGVLVALVAGLWGPVVFLLGFTLWQGMYRWRTFSWGWRLGLQVTEALRDQRLRQPARIAGWVAAACAGAVSVALLATCFHHIGGDRQGWLVVVVFLGALTTAGVWVHGQRSSVWALAGGFGWAFAASFGDYFIGQ